MHNIYLVGFMGAGKTSVGRELARHMGWTFIDLDGRLEDSFGMPVHEIFRSRGESAFREAERQSLEWTSGLHKTVVATGGGAFCDPVNRNIMHSTGGCSVFLEVPWQVLVERLEADHGDRPKFTGAAAARRLYDTRVPHYKEATCTVVLTGSESPEEAAVRIADRVAGVPCGT